MSVRLLIGDARERLAELEAGSVQLCVCSPPYHSLRCYPIPDSVWGGVVGCGHAWGEAEPGKRSRWGDLSTLSGKQASNTGSEEMVAALEAPAGCFCAHCGAWRGQLGLEATPELYVDHLVEVFRGVRRVLHDMGVLFVNIADSYAGSGKGRNRDGVHSAQHGDKQATNRGTLEGRLWKTGLGRDPRGHMPDGLQQGDLIGIPWRLAFAMQADGWILRSAMVLAKANPMPESQQGVRWERHRVKVAESRRAEEGSKHAQARAGVSNGHGARDGAEFDSRAEWQDCPGCATCAPNDGMVLRWGSGRPTSAYEMLFAFAAGPRYFWNSEGVRRPHKPESLKRYEYGLRATCGNGSEDRAAKGGDGALNCERLGDHMNPAGANALNWMYWQPSPSGEEHYAAYGIWLPDFCIRAATPEGVCSRCRAPYAPVIERGEADREWQRACGGNGEGEYHGQAVKDYGPGGAQDASAVKARILAGMAARSVSGWRATCRCGAPKAPALVLDCFAGTCTTGVAADRLGRDAVMIDASEKYIDIGRRRLAKDAGLFADVSEGGAASRQNDAGDTQDGRQARSGPSRAHGEGHAKN